MGLVAQTYFVYIDEDFEIIWQNEKTSGAWNFTFKSALP